MDNLLFTLVCVFLIILSIYHLFQYDICRQKIARVKDLLDVNKHSNSQLMAQVREKESQYRKLRAINHRNRSLLENHLDHIKYHTRDTEKEAADNLRHFKHSREVQKLMLQNTIKQKPVRAKTLGGFDADETGLSNYKPGQRNDKHQLLMENFSDGNDTTHFTS